MTATTANSSPSVHHPRLPPGRPLTIASLWVHFASCRARWAISSFPWSAPQASRWGYGVPRGLRTTSVREHAGLHRPQVGVGAGTADELVVRARVDDASTR